MSFACWPDDQLIDCSASSASSDCEVPNAPVFRAEECLSEGNIITLVWQPCLGFGIDYYTLEIDDGAGGAFRKVYRGIETMCTIEGLHFKSMYRARVKAHNPSGYSAYSDRLVIQTSTHSWFHMDPSRSSVGGLQFSNSNRSLTCQSMEDCVALASTGLSRGIHYWEFVIDRLDAGGQPSFGIAKSDCNKEAMLGRLACSRVFAHLLRVPGLYTRFNGHRLITSIHHSFPISLMLQIRKWTEVN
ncbi:E3 ubiquitin-protein ligase TRIM9 [Taenia solium]|eukprot:TsM_000793900 transcript=TsM_000793900 gene=TsM_000793900